MSRHLGEIESICENDKKTYHIAVVLTIRDTSSLQYFGFPPSRMSILVLAASFTRGFVNPAVDPTCLVIPILIAIVVLVVLMVFVLIILVVLVGEQVSEYCQGIVVVIVIIVTCPLDSFGWLSLDCIKCGYEFRMNVWRSST